MGCYCTTSCGDLDNPPSRTNLTLLGIIEIVIMIVVGIVCLIDLIRLIQIINKSHNSLGVLEILKIVEYVIIVSGLVMIVYGLFCSPRQGPAKTGIGCFCVGTILAIVVVVLVIYYGWEKDSLLYNILYMIFLIFLAYILWRQSARL